MIIKTQAFLIQCNNCEAEFEDYSGFSLFSDECQAHPEDRGWYADDDTHYCPKCHEISHNDELIIKPHER